MSKQRKLRPLGVVMLEMEPLLEEAMNHELQHGDMLALIHVWLLTHRPSDREVYTADGSSPIFYYGPAINQPGGEK